MSESPELSEWAEFSNQRMKRAYSELGEDYYSASSASTRYVDLLRMIGRAGRVLDVGCFIGKVGELVMRQGNEVYGIDAFGEGVEMARKRGIKAVQGSVERSLPFDDAFFDAVYSMDVIEHIVDTDLYINEMKRVLKPGGILVITTPNVASLGRRLYLLFGLNPFLEASLTYPDWVSGHVRFFTMDLLLDYLRYMGLIIEEFCSDALIFSPGGRIWSRRLAKILPRLGRNLIVKSRKKAADA